MTTIAAALCWYDEPPASLERCLRSLDGVADFIVPADGRWQGFADDQPASSSDDQRHRVLDVGAELAAHLVYLPVPARPFESQVAKRALIYSIAAKYAEWVLVIDADEWVEHAGPHELRQTLEATDLLVADVALRHERGPKAGPGTVARARLFATHAGGLTVQGMHNGVRTGDGRWLTGDPAYLHLEPAIDVGDQLGIFHDQGASRPHERELADREYTRYRAKHQLEHWRSDPA